MNLIDASDAIFGNSILKWSKLTVRPWFDHDDLSTGRVTVDTFLMMVYKQDQDDASVPSLDNMETIREMKRDKKVVRGPWYITAPQKMTDGFIPFMAGHLKPMVFRNFVLDREDDLRVAFTNVGLAIAVAQFQMVFGMMGWYRKIA